MILQQKPKKLQTALERIVSEAPYLPRCSDDKTATRVRPVEYAVKYPYMQINRQDFVSWLIFDLDHANPNAWQDAGLPPPSIIVRNRRNNHSHLYYAIAPVYTGESARPKPIAYMRAVYKAYAKAMDADMNYRSGPVAKTPGHQWWCTTELHHGVYELGDLAEYVQLEVEPFQRTEPAEAQASHSRHGRLFDDLRHFAYRNVADFKGSYGAFYEMLLRQAARLNTYAAQGYAENLRETSLKATAKSIARWTWTRYTGTRKCQRGAMVFDGGETTTEKQAAAARRTHDIRTNKTAERVHYAALRLIKQGLQLTKQAVAREAGIARQTVSKYWQLALDLLTPPDNLVEFPAAAGVNYGVHQVPAPAGAPSAFSIVNLHGSGKQNNQREHSAVIHRNTIRKGPNAVWPDGRRPASSSITPYTGPDPDDGQ
jgi:hypothetical protein